MNPYCIEGFVGALVTGFPPLQDHQFPWWLLSPVKLHVLFDVTIDSLVDDRCLMFHTQQKRQLPPGLWLWFFLVSIWCWYTRENKYFIIRETYKLTKSSTSLWRQSVAVWKSRFFIFYSQVTTYILVIFYIKFNLIILWLYSHKIPTLFL